MLDTHSLMVYNAYMTNDNDNTVECGLCQESKPLSNMAYGLVWGEKVCEPCMTTMTNYNTDK